MIHVYSSVFATLSHLKRTCPRCRKGVVVPMSKRLQSVQCPDCKATIPVPPSR